MTTYAMDCTTETCGRGPEGCGGETFTRLSRSGLTRSTICEAHAEALERSLNAVERRYPEVNHPDDCGCYGCSEGSW
jgi:hypothetical protein